MKMKELPFEVGFQYLLNIGTPDTPNFIVGVWTGSGFRSVKDSNDEDYLDDADIWEYCDL